MPFKATSSAVARRSPIVIHRSSGCLFDSRFLLIQDSGTCRYLISNVESDMDRSFVACSP